MAEKVLITAARLRELLHYEQETGVFRWRVSPRYQINAGDITGYLNSRGYRVIRVDGRNYFAHRLAFLWAEGRWPRKEIDHANGDKADNRWSNLELYPAGKRFAARAEAGQVPIMFHLGIMTPAVFMVKATAPPVPECLVAAAIAAADGLLIDAFLSPHPGDFSVAAWSVPPYSVWRIGWRATLYKRIFFRGCSIKRQGGGCCEGHRHKSFARFASPLQELH